MYGACLMSEGREQTFGADAYVESCGEKTTCANCGDTGMFYEPYLAEWVPCRVCRPEDWEANRG